MKTAIVMTACSRPAYTVKVLDALSKCEGIDRIPVCIMCEPVDDDVINAAIAFSRLPHVKCDVQMGKTRAGCNVNTYYALSEGFSRADAVIALEDDTVPGRDFLRFCEWGLAKYQKDPAVFSVCGYQRTPVSEVGFRSAVVRESWFTPWGWATWRDRWDSIRDTWPAKDHEVSWDTVIDKVTRRDRFEVRPMLARIQNIGAEAGTHVPSAEWHRANHLNPNWIDSVRGPRVDEWCEVPAETTKAMRRDHPC